MMVKVSVSLSPVFYEDSELRLSDSAGESETDVTAMATYQINKFKLHFERAFNYLSHDITHVYDKKSNAFF